MIIDHVASMWCMKEGRDMEYREIFGLMITKGCALEIPGRRNREAERIAG